MNRCCNREKKRSNKWIKWYKNQVDRFVNLYASCEFEIIISRDKLWILNKMLKLNRLFCTLQQEFIRLFEQLKSGYQDPQSLKQYMFYMIAFAVYTYVPLIVILWFKFVDFHFISDYFLSHLIIYTDIILKTIAEMDFRIYSWKVYWSYHES